MDEMQTMHPGHGLTDWAASQETMQSPWAVGHCANKQQKLPEQIGLRLQLKASLGNGTDTSANDPVQQVLPFLSTMTSVVQHSKLACIWQPLFIIQ